jgi:hypothetical protein
MNTNDDIIPRLKFISRLKKGDKINVKNLYIQPNNFYNRIDRSFFNVDDRTNTLIFVQTTIKKGFELFNTHIAMVNPYDKILCGNLLSDLRNTKVGLLNLKETYIDDVMFVCKIDALIEETDAKLADLDTKYKLEEEKKE